MDTLSTIGNFSFSAAVRPEISADAASDHTLIAAVGIGDDDAFAELVERYRDAIVSYIYRMTNDYGTAVDLAQETFVRVYWSASRYENTHAFSTYLYRIASNLAISELRIRKRKNLISLTGYFDTDEGASSHEFAPLDPRPQQDMAMIDEERRKTVQDAISKLPDKYRAPLILRDIEGRSYEDICVILDSGLGTVKSRICRGRGLLRKKLRQCL